MDQYNPSDLIMVDYSPEPLFQFRLPAVTDEKSSLNISVYIRDKLDAVTECILPPVIIEASDIETKMFENATGYLNVTDESDIFVQLLATANQQTTKEVIVGFTQLLNKLNLKNIKTTSASKTLLIGI